MSGNFWGKDFALSRGGNKLIVRGLGEIWGDRGFWERFGCGDGRGLVEEKLLIYHLLNLVPQFQKPTQLPDNHHLTLFFTWSECDLFATTSLISYYMLLNINHLRG